MEKKMEKFWRYTYCGGEGGLVIADTREGAMERVGKKYGWEEACRAQIWEWESDDYYDRENPEVLSIYDCG